MNIGCDLDGVIIDHRKNQRQLLLKRGFDIGEDKISKDLIESLLGPVDLERFKTELYDGMGLTAGEIKGAKEAVAHLASRHDFRIISKRKNPELAIQWLGEHGFNRVLDQSRMHFVSENRDKDGVCREFKVELHIDDLPEVLEKLTAPQHKILFGASGPHPAATAVVENWDELLKYIEYVS